MKLRLARPWACYAAVFTALAFFVVDVALAHGVAEGDKGYIEETTGPQIGAFLYLGAKHMVTGYDHLLFLFGVIFFLYRPRDVVLYVSLFTIGHSITLLAGVLAGVRVDLPDITAPGLTTKRINAEPFVVVVNREGHYFLNDNEEPLADSNGIRIAVKAVLRNSPEVEFWIRAHRNVEYEFVVRAIDEMMDGGAVNVSFITDSSKY